MIMASNKTFYVSYLSDQIKFGQTNLLYIIINEKLNTVEKQVSG